MTLSRRTFLSHAALAVASFDRLPAVIDTHTHFYDIGRPQGVP